MTRNNRLDTIKGILIILVILGHLIGQCGGDDDINGYANTFIYTFHMPLFILLSGYLTKIRNNRHEFFKSIFSIAKPLVVFQIINVVFIGIGGGEMEEYWSLVCSLLDIMVSS